MLRRNHTCFGTPSLVPCHRCLYGTRIRGLQSIFMIATLPLHHTVLPGAVCWTSAGTVVPSDPWESAPQKMGIIHQYQHPTLDPVECLTGLKQWTGPRNDKKVSNHKQSRKVSMALVSQGNVNTIGQLQVFQPVPVHRSPFTVRTPGRSPSDHTFEQTIPLHTPVITMAM